MNDENDNVPVSAGVTHMDKQDQAVKKKHLVPALIALVVLLSIATGFLTYLLLTENTDTDKNNSEEVSQQDTDIDNSIEVREKSEGPEEDFSMSREWRDFDSLEYTVKLPDGWDFEHQDNGVLIYSCSDSECYKISEGSRATVEEVLGGRDGLQGLLVTIQPADYTIEEITAGYTKEKEINNDFTLYKSVKTEDATFETLGDQLPIGTVDYIAVKTIEGGATAYFGYSVLPNQNDPTDIVDVMINTFEVK